MTERTSHSNLSTANFQLSTSSPGARPSRRSLRAVAAKPLMLMDRASRETVFTPGRLCTLKPGTSLKPTTAAPGCNLRRYSVLWIMSVG